MGAIQAQEYEMAKWAIGIRLRSSSLETVNEALYKGDILRTHVMRPTWHFVAAEERKRLTPYWTNVSLLLVNFVGKRLW